MSQPTGGQVTAADGVVLRTASRDLENLGGRLALGHIPLNEANAALLEGAGDVGPLLADGADLFVTSWTGVMAVCSDACGLVAGNLGRFVTDLTAADVAGGRGYRL